MCERPGECRSPNNAMDQYWCRCHELLGEKYFDLPEGKCLADEPERGHDARPVR